MRDLDRRGSSHYTHILSARCFVWEVGFCSSTLSSKDTMFEPGRVISPDSQYGIVRLFDGSKPFRPTRDMFPYVLEIPSVWAGFFVVVKAYTAKAR